MNPKRYKKKPVVIEAVKWDGLKSTEDIIRTWSGQPLRYNIVDRSLTIPTLEGDHRADIGDMIIKGIQGELYPCKPDIFKETYERVE